MQRPHRLATRPAPLIASAIACACLSLAPSAIARTDPPSPLPAALGQPSAAAPQPTIIHETIAAKDTGDNTVPIALAAGALARRDRRYRVLHHHRDQDQSPNHGTQRESSSWPRRRVRAPTNRGPRR